MRRCSALLAGAALLMAGTAVAKTPSYDDAYNLPKQFGVIFASLQAKDIERSKDFYVNVLGMEILNIYHEDKSKPVREYQLVFRDTPAAGGFNLIHNTGEAFPAGRPIHIVVRVKDLVATCAKVEKAGGKLERECKPPKPGGLSVGMALDPDGHKLELIQY